MDRVPVSSSNIAAVGYDENSSMLEVEFKSGSVYRYFGVPAQHFRALSGGSVSVGRYLNTEIKPRYPCEQVA
jgi:hypothetical protein